MWDETSAGGFSLSKAFMALFGGSKCCLSQVSPPTSLFPHFGAATLGMELWDAIPCGFGDGGSGPPWSDTCSFSIWGQSKLVIEFCFNKNISCKTQTAPARVALSPVTPAGLESLL